MDRRTFLKTTGGMASALAQGAQKSPAKRPNILFILADDVGYGDVRCFHAASKIPTPNIDRMAREGIRFTDAHSPSGVCSPTRYGVLTGRYAWRGWLKRGVLLAYSPAMIEEGRLTVAGLLQQQGYRTAAVGKWHVGMTFTKANGEIVTQKDGYIRDASQIDFSKPITGGPVDCGFDYFFGNAACPTTDYLYSYIENRATVGRPTIAEPGGNYEKDQPMTEYRAGMRSPGFDLTTVDVTLKDVSVRFLEEHAKARPEQPFFLYHAMSGAHMPILPAKEFRGKSGVGLYGDFVMEADWVVGELIKTVDRLGLGENTIIIFTSDNGPEVCVREVRQAFGHNASGTLRGLKRDNWEGGHRVPFVARWTGRIPKGATSTETLCLTDLMATAAAASGATLPDNAGEDSYNMLPALLGKKGKRPIREATVHHSFDGSFAIRQGDWKLMLHQGAGDNNYVKIAPEPPVSEPEAAGQLYNLRTDPQERVNLYRRRPEIVARLTALLKQYQDEGRSRPKG
jgi:arylsulfatase A-like enzyme